MATIERDVTEESIIGMNTFGLIMQQNVIENKFNPENDPRATIQLGASI